MALYYDKMRLRCQASVATCLRLCVNQSQTSTTGSDISFLPFRVRHKWSPALPYRQVRDNELSALVRWTKIFPHSCIQGSAPSRSSRPRPNFHLSLWRWRNCSSPVYCESEYFPLGPSWHLGPWRLRQFSTSSYCGSEYCQPSLNGISVYGCGRNLRPAHIASQSGPRT